MSNAYIAATKVFKLDTGSATLLAAGKPIWIDTVVHSGGTAGNAATLTDGNDQEFIKTTSSGNMVFVSFPRPRKINGLKTGTIAGGTVYVYLAEEAGT